MSLKKIQGLDALRAIAVICVIITHWGPNSFKNFPALTFFFQKILPSGEFGVNFFFVLSGFLITRILLNSKQNMATKSRLHLLKAFIIRRSLRIFPIYYLFLAFLFIVNYPQIRDYILYFASYTSNYLCFIKASWNSLGHTWSLSVEEQFYLVWPWIIIFLPDKHVLKAILVFIFAGTLLDMLTTHYFGFFASILTFNCFNAFATGGLYACVLVEERWKKVILKTLRYLLPLALVIYILNIAGTHFLPARLIESILSINLIIYVTEKRWGKITGYIFNNKILNSLGKVSYGIYLYHYVIPSFYKALIKFLEQKIMPSSSLFFILHNRVIAEVAEFCCLFILAYCSFYFIEAPILRLKKRFDYVPKEAVAALTGPPTPK